MLGSGFDVLLRLLVLFIAAPFVEMTLLLLLADVTSWQVALALVIVTGIAGSWLTKSQGTRTFRRIREELAAGRMPAEDLLDAVLIFLAGTLLLTPGILSDLLGLSIMIPYCRRFYRQRLIKWFKARFNLQAFTPSTGAPAQGSSEVIDSYVVDRTESP